MGGVTYECLQKTYEPEVGLSSITIFGTGEKYAKLVKPREPPSLRRGATHSPGSECAGVGLDGILRLGQEKYTYIGVCLRGIIGQGKEGPCANSTREGSP